MNQRQLLLTTALMVMACLASVQAYAVDESRKQEGPIGAFLGKPRMEAQPLFKAIRHPNVVVSLKGTVLATLGDKKLLARRSVDGGKTWGEEIIVAEPAFQGGGLTVDETTGDILAFAEDRHPPAPLSVYRSQDDGKTWQKIEVIIHPDTRGNVPSMHMSEHGITLRHGKHAGRLIRAARHYGEANYPKKHWPTHYTTAIYSDDHGKTWKTSNPFSEMGTGEAGIAELSDGRLYYNSRSHWNAKEAAAAAPRGMERRRRRDLDRLADRRRPARRTAGHELRLLCRTCSPADCGPRHLALQQLRQHCRPQTWHGLGELRRCKDLAFEATGVERPLPIFLPFGRHGQVRQAQVGSTCTLKADFPRHVSHGLTSPG